MNNLEKDLREQSRLVGVNTMENKCIKCNREAKGRLSLDFEVGKGLPYCAEHEEVVQILFEQLLREREKIEKLWA